MIFPTTILCGHFGLLAGRRSSCEVGIAFRRLRGRPAAISLAASKPSTSTKGLDARGLFGSRAWPAPCLYGARFLGGAVAGLHARCRNLFARSDSSRNLLHTATQSAFAAVFVLDRLLSVCRHHFS